MNEIIRTILELIGLSESKQSVLNRKLALISKELPPGKATLLVKGLGKKENSAVSAIRDVTKLDIQEVLTYTGMLPAPLLINVSQETAVFFQKKLARIGVETEIIGIYDDELPRQQRPRPEIAAKTVGPKHGSARSTAPFPVQPGNYTATLTTVGLLADRVLAGVQQITGRKMLQQQALEEALPLTLLTGVDQDTAIKAQTLLQMVGAVVDIDETVTGETAVVSPPAAPTETGAAAGGYGLRLLRLGAERVRAVRAVADALQIDPLEAAAIVDAAPRQLLANVDADTVLRVASLLEAVGAVVEILEPPS